jgi:hypothetical protein
VLRIQNSRSASQRGTCERDNKTEHKGRRSRNASLGSYEPENFLVWRELLRSRVISIALESMDDRMNIILLFVVLRCHTYRCRNIPSHTLFLGSSTRTGALNVEKLLITRDDTKKSLSVWACRLTCQYSLFPDLESHQSRFLHSDFLSYPKLCVAEPCRHLFYQNSGAQQETLLSGTPVSVRPQQNEIE